MEDNKKDFKPYIPADKVVPEFTFTSIALGVVLAIVFGAANAYLGLRVGMTVSASIPAAVISMGIFRLIKRKNAILESNMVQTVGSAGESLAAGAIFTMPVIFLWAKEGVADKPSLLTISMISLCGGVLGVLFMIPLRNALIVKEHGVLPYPEGTACAEVLLAGEKGGSGAKSVFFGIGFASLFKFLVDGFKVIPGTITAVIKPLKTELSAEVYPALLGVGYICGPKISSYMLAGGILGWFVFIPAIAIFGADTILYPGTEAIKNIYLDGGASAIWSNYIRYIGAGMVAAGGIISLIKSMPLIFSTFKGAIVGMKDAGGKSTLRTEKDLNMKVVLIGVAVIILLIWLFPAIPVSLVGAILITIFGFFFGAVSSRMVGIVGSSNNPVSGMAIATLLFSTFVLKLTGDTGASGMVGAIAIGTIICIVTAMAGDTSQDLKTGFLLGATPVKQQIGEIIGAFVSAIAIGGVLILLDKAWGFGTTELSAPQASLMKMIVEGVMQGNLPWGLVFIGVFMAIVVEILGIPVLPVAIGLYLPLELSTSVMIGGVIRWFVDKKSKVKSDDSGSGVLFCSGLIAGEGLVGVLLAVLAVLGVEEKINLSEFVNLGTVGGIILLIIMIGCVVFFAMNNKAEGAEAGGGKKAEKTEK